MRDINRIEPFMVELEKKWKKVPDMRFGQFMSNVLGEVYELSGHRDIFFIEDEKMMDYINRIEWLKDKE